mmetsp:Transcript_17628/g.54970  ORF Transcript_17628/g.54970 Transcript_17628/m.54970 type:complete len:288 (-) Transcript_17628:121-984(-)
MSFHSTDSSNGLPLRSTHGAPGCPSLINHRPSDHHVDPKIERHPLDHIIHGFRKKRPHKGPSVLYDAEIDEMTPPEAEVAPPVVTGDVRRQAQFDPLNWFTSLFQYKGSAIHIFPILLVNVFAVVIFLVVFYVIPWDVSRGITKHTQNDVFYLSFPLFFLLAMRVQLCYNRWWEARSLWGLTISRSRNLARLAILYLPRQDRPRFCALIVAWAVAKKRHLRDERTMLLELADVLGPCDRRDAATAKHPPLWFLDALSRYVAETEAAGGMDSQQAQNFHDQHQWPSGC